MRQLELRASHVLPGELVVDNFAGGGGASTGIEAALGRPVDIAINHSPSAIAMHRANHPETRHYCENIWEVDPREACGSRPVGLAWFSPDCTHFSRAKGTQPVKKEIRGLAWVVVRWAETVRPRVIVLENVEEFQTWGPIGADSRPDPKKLGETFREWLGRLSDLGYTVEFRSLVAADYGTPTTRRRLFLVARCDGAPAIWPDATHGKGRAHAWRPASQIIDWTLSCPSIFARRRPLAEATLKRIAAGLKRYVIDAADPFIVPVTHQGDARVHGVDEPVRTITAANRGKLALVEPVCPIVTKHYGRQVGHDVAKTLGTVTARDHHALTAAFLTKFYGTCVGAPAHAPLPTVTSGGGRGGGHLAEVRAYLLKYYGAEGRPAAQDMALPLHTVTTRARFGLVMVRGEPYEIVDIGMRMLQPHELFRAQGFPDTYQLAPEHPDKGRPLTKTEQIELAGNSVCPQVAEAIIAANVCGGMREVA